MKKGTYVIFSFKNITTNKRYNFEFFKKDFKTKLQAYTSLIERIIEIENTDWIDFINKPKISGMESMKFNQINFKPNNYTILADDKVISIRFSNQKYRIIGIKDNNVFRIFGFDFNYKAYKHD